MCVCVCACPGRARARARLPPLHRVFLTTLKDREEIVTVIYDSLNCFLFVELQ